MPSHVGILGHSEGGLIAPIVAARCKDVAFIVLIGAPGVPGDQILIQQLEAIGRANGESEQKLARQRAASEEMYALIKKEPDSTHLDADFTAVLGRQVAAADSESAAIGGPGEEKRMVKVMMSPWFRSFVACDPRPIFERVSCPVLAVNGVLDLQVPAGENLPAIQSALKEGGNPDVTIEELPGLNHLLQEAKTGSPREYGKIEQTMSPLALRLIGDWITVRTGNGRSNGTGG